MPAKKKTTAKKTPRSGKKPLTAKQKRAIQLLKKAVLGEMSVEQALKQAGYADSTARQQKEVMDSLRHNSAMQEALRAAEFTEEFVAQTLVKDIVRLRPGQARRQYLELGAKLLDVFPAQKNINAEASIADLIKSQEENTPE